MFSVISICTFLLISSTKEYPLFQARNAALLSPKRITVTVINYLDPKILSRSLSCECCRLIDASIVSGVGPCSTLRTFNVVTFQIEQNISPPRGHPSKAATITLPCRSLFLAKCDFAYVGEFESKATAFMPS